MNLVFKRLWGMNLVVRRGMESERLVDDLDDLTNGSEYGWKPVAIYYGPSFKQNVAHSNASS